MRAALVLSLAAICSPVLAAAEQPGDWQAVVGLHAVGDGAAPLPEVLVPKQSVVLNVTVWMPQGINWNPQYPQWDMPGATLLALMMLSPSIEREHGSFSQRGATQNYLLTPLVEGELALSPTALTVYPDQPDSPVLPIAPVNLQVALPDGAASIEQFLPATKLKLDQHYYLQSGDEAAQELQPEALAQLKLQPGQMLERRISIEALGIQGNQIPPLPVDADAVQHEFETADLNSYGDFSGGKRTEHWFYAPGNRTTLELRDLSVRWYELGSRSFKVSQLTGGRVSAEVNRAVDARLQLDWREKLALVSPWYVAAMLAGIVLLGAAFRYRRIVVWGARRAARAYRQYFHEAEFIQFARLCCLIGVLGLSSQRSWKAFQRWHLIAGATADLGDTALLQLWGGSRFGGGGVELPPRFGVLRELLRLRLRSLGRKKTTIRDRYLLPELTAASSASGAPREMSNPANVR